ncbi:secreted RxLR effector protein 161-like, partial [Vigna umbellata]|uniref:secreted RxLR effector protein 161-like n=1 Tax=Vigna umbellata TaxID=87088 RepID=UPI001F5FC81C
MESIPYASIVRSLMYAQICTLPDISFVVGMLGRYQSNPGMDHWKNAKKAFRYPQSAKDYMLTYKRSYHLKVIDYSDSDYAGCVDSRKATFGGRYQSNPGMDHRKNAKKAFRYQQSAKDYMLTYKRSYHLKVIDYSDSDYAGCVDSRKATFG